MLPRLLWEHTQWVVLLLGLHLRKELKQSSGVLDVVFLRLTYMSCFIKLVLQLVKWNRPETYSFLKRMMHASMWAYLAHKSIFENHARVLVLPEQEYICLEFLVTGIQVDVCKQSECNKDTGEANKGPHEDISISMMREWTSARISTCPVSCKGSCTKRVVWLVNNLQYFHCGI